jgi:hypothetical protein
MTKGKPPTPKRGPDSSSSHRADDVASAVFTLDASATGVGVEGDVVTRRVRDLIHKVTEEVGNEPKNVQVFGKIGAFAVEASPQFLERLSAQKGVASSSSNDAGEDLLIRPVSPRRSHKASPRG